MTEKIIIEIMDALDPSMAIDLVSRVVKGGRVSKANNIAHFCWLSIYEVDGVTIEVCTRNKRTATSADSFIVSKQ